MAMTSIRCPILGSYVALDLDFEGAISKVFCQHYDSATCTCRIKTEAMSGGPLSQLLERVADDSLNSRTNLCVLLSR